jgi:hypothetical protein
MQRLLFGLTLALLAAGFLAAPRAAQQCEFHVSPVLIDLDGAPRADSVGIETQPGCGWTVDSTVSWIHLGTSGGSGQGVITFLTDPAPAFPTMRQGIIRVRWNTPTAGQNVLVTQINEPCRAAMSPAPGPISSETFGGKGGSGDFWVLGDTFTSPWRVIGAPDWIGFTNPPLFVLRSGDGDAAFVVAPNPSTGARDGTVTFCSGLTINVHQAGRSVRGGRFVPADFDDDGLADLAVYRPSSGTWYALRSQSGYSDYVTVQWGTAGMFAIPGDFDGDNRTDFAVYDPAGLFGAAPAGNWNIRYSSNGYSAVTRTSWAFPTRAYGYTPQDLPLLADFNGDGRPDFVTYRPGSGEWAVQLTDPRLPSRLPDHFPSGEYNGHWQWGLPGDIPVPADYDGDGLADLAVWRPSTGTWFIRLSSEDYSTATARAFQWGLPGDQPIVGDFDGDGRADLAVWRPSDGAWYIVYSSQGYSQGMMTRIQWGLPGDVPVANDYDGDSRTDLAVWRPSNGTWYLLLSSRQYDYAAARTIQWGLPGDIPLSARIIGAQ